MRYYVYISESKINMLFSQIANSENEQRESSLGFDLKILKGEMKETRGLPENKFTQLNKVLNELTKNNSIGSIHENKPYIKATLKMTWASFGYEPDTPITYWSYVSKNISLGLGGSKRNIIGRDPGGITNSYSQTSSIIYYLRNELENAMPPRNDDDLPAYMRTEMQQWRLRGHAAEGVLRAGELPGERATFDFVAKVLFRVPEKFENQSRGVILATPLYVALND